MKKIIIILAMFIYLSIPAVTLATTADDLFWGGSDIESEVDTAIGLGKEDPRVIIANVIKVAMGFLGIVAVIIIMLGGFKWMAAAGAEDKVEEAKKLLTAGIIGLIIIMAAWGLTSFVMGAIYDATTGA